jgi:hypothetical protein
VTKWAALDGQLRLARRGALNELSTPVAGRVERAPPPQLRQRARRAACRLTDGHLTPAQIAWLRVDVGDLQMIGPRGRHAAQLGKHQPRRRRTRLTSPPVSRRRSQPGAGALADSRSSARRRSARSCRFGRHLHVRIAHVQSPWARGLPVDQDSPKRSGAVTGERRRPAVSIND